MGAPVAVCVWGGGCGFMGTPALKGEHGLRATFAVIGSRYRVLVIGFSLSGPRYRVPSPGPRPHRRGGRAAAPPAGGRGGCGRGRCRGEGAGQGSGRPREERARAAPGGGPAAPQSPPRLGKPSGHGPGQAAVGDPA